MKNMKILLLMLFLPLLSCQADDSSLSGYLKGGLRYLPVDSGKKTLEYRVYRGDYIVFELPPGEERNFTIPAQNLDVTLPRSEGESPYIKMKESGNFSFTLGDESGTIEVIEMTGNHYTELTSKDAYDFIGNTSPLILDVRTDGEFARGHIPGATLIPVQILEDNLDNLADFKDRDILVYCASGNRSTVASRLLIDAGFKRVYNLRYGIGDWINKGLPLE